MQFIKRHVAAILFVVIAVALVVFGSRLLSESARMIDVLLFGFFCSALLVLPAVDAGDKILKKLKELEPKTGAGPCSVSAVDARLHRNDLERTMASTLAPYLVNSNPARSLGAYIRDAVDAILNEGQPIKMKCTLPESRGCNCAQVFGSGVQSAGAATDQPAEVEIIGQGLTAPRVTDEKIEALLSLVTYRYDQPDGTRHTFAHAFLGDFYLATGYAAPVSIDNFDAAKGITYSREQAVGKARDKLWELEGYKLHGAIVGQ